MKYQEGVVWGAMMGAFGGCFAVRRACYHPAPAEFLVDDFYITMAVLRDGYQAINELDAICYEDVSDHLPEEFRRKARISAGNFQNLGEFRPLLCPPWRGVAFAWWSHKVLRWCTPQLLLLLLAATVGLVAAGRAGFSGWRWPGSWACRCCCCSMPRCSAPGGTPGCCASSRIFTA